MEVTFHVDIQEPPGPQLFIRTTVFKEIRASLQPTYNYQNHVHETLLYKPQTPSLGLSHLSQSSDGGSDSSGSSGGDRVSTTGNGLVTGMTVPDTGRFSLDGLLTTERAVVSGVLLDLQLLGLTTKGGTVTDTKLTSDTDLFSSLSPVNKC